MIEGQNQKKQSQKQNETNKEKSIKFQRKLSLIEDLKERQTQYQKVRYLDFDSSKYKRNSLGSYVSQREKIIDEKSKFHKQSEPKIIEEIKTLSQIKIEIHNQQIQKQQKWNINHVLLVVIPTLCFIRLWFDSLFPEIIDFSI